MTRKANVKIKKLAKTGRSYNQALQSKIAGEVISGLIGERAATRKYGVSRPTIAKWVREKNLATLLDDNPKSSPMPITESQENRLLVNKIKELTKALEHERLKTTALETMIEVAETDLHIKIRKKRGTKQS